MKRLILSICFVCFLVNCSMVIADETRRDDVLRALEFTGISSTVEALPSVMTSSLHHVLFVEMDTDVINPDQLVYVVNTSFEEVDLLNVVIDRIVLALDKDELENIVSWYDSPNGEKIRQTTKSYEKEVEKIHEFMQAIQSYHEDLAKNPMPEQRRNMLVSAIEGSGTKESYKSMAKISMGAIMVVDSLVPAEMRMGEEMMAEIRREAEAELEKIDVVEETFIHIAYMTRELDDEVIESYAKFAVAEPMVKFRKGFLEGLELGLAEAIEKMITLADEVSSEKE